MKAEICYAHLRHELSRGQGEVSSPPPIQESPIYLPEIPVDRLETGADTAEIAADIAEIGCYMKDIAGYRLETRIAFMRATPDWQVIATCSPETAVNSQETASCTPETA